MGQLRVAGGLFALVSALCGICSAGLTIYSNWRGNALQATVAAAGLAKEASLHGRLQASEAKATLLEGQLTDTSERLQDATLQRRLSPAQTAALEKALSSLSARYAAEFAKAPIFIPAVPPIMNIVYDDDEETRQYANQFRLIAEKSGWSIGQFKSKDHLPTKAEELEIVSTQGAFGVRMTKLFAQALNNSGLSTITRENVYSYDRDLDLLVRRRDSKFSPTPKPAPPYEKAAARD